MWFVRTLVEQGHHVVATFRGRDGDYEGLRAERVRLAAAATDARYGVAFGDDAFLSLLNDGFDVVCHHGADVTDYRSDEFDVASAFNANTNRAAAVAARTPALVLTGSVFEQDEGVGETPLRAFSPYGLAKGLTSQAFAFYATRATIRFGKFVIPNPIGPYEEPRFTSYLVRTWRSGEVPRVQTPAYVRDNIHVSLLARAYVRFVEDVANGAAERLAPTGYVESQGAFARRFAAELGPRLGLAAPVELAVQTEFPEPRVRINVDRVEFDDWDEGRAWDDLAAFYDRQTPA
jgi:nucleoside-diphosphate-sugar epimerase